MVYLPNITRALLSALLMLALCSSPQAEEIQAQTNTAVASSKITCADFLEKLNKKPKNLEYIGCEKTSHTQLSALESRYRVRGVNAKEVEAFFVKTAHMPKLVRNCCLWESVSRDPKQPQDGVYRTGGDFLDSYWIEMSSGETLVRDWKDIPYFYVTVRIYLELP